MYGVNLEDGVNEVNVVNAVNLGEGMRIAWENLVNWVYEVIGVRGCWAVGLNVGCIW